MSFGFRCYRQHYWSETLDIPTGRIDARLDEKLGRRKGSGVYRGFQCKYAIVLRRVVKYSFVEEQSHNIAVPIKTRCCVKRYRPPLCVDCGGAYISSSLYKNLVNLVTSAVSGCTQWSSKQFSRVGWIWVSTVLQKKLDYFNMPLS
jgi:hypothetical protein